MKKLILVIFLIICVLSFSKKKEIERTDIPVLTLDITQEFPYEDYYPGCLGTKSICLTWFKDISETFA